MRKFKNLVRTIAVKNKESVYTLYPASYINIKVFNPFKYNLVICIHCIANTNNIAVGNYCFQVLVYLVGLTFRDNKRRDNITVYIYYFCNCNRFTAKRLAYFIPCYLIINKKYLFFFALPYTYA